MTPEVEREILTYLRQDAADRRAQAERERLRDSAIQNLANAQQLTNQKIDSLRDLYDERFRGISARVAKLETDVDDTGKHAALTTERLLAAKKEELERELAEAKATIAKKESDEKTASAFWKQEWFKAGLAVIGVIAAAALLSLLHIGGK